MKEWLVGAVRRERERATKEFGPLTTDRFRALALLTEEVGETAQALLELRRAEDRASRTGDERSALGRTVEDAEDHAVEELVQVLSLASLLAEQIQEAQLKRVVARSEASEGGAG